MLVSLCALLILSSASKGQPMPAAVEDQGRKTPVAKDSSDTFVALSKRPKPMGLLITSLVRGGGRLWAVGDSGLVAHSADDSTFTRVPTPFHGAFHCADWADGALVCAGDSGRVCRISGDKVLVATTLDDRTVRDLSMAGSWAFMGGDEGLLAASQDGGRSWSTVKPPLPMRFYAVLIHGGAWWAGGAGGRVYRSLDRGASWDLAGRSSAPIVDLEKAGGESVVALDREGGLLQLSSSQGRELGRRTPDATTPPSRWLNLLAVDGGWMLSGDGAHLARLDTLSGQWTALPSFGSTALPALAASGKGVVAAGAWGSVANWERDAASPRLLGNVLRAGGVKEAMGMVDVAVPQELPPVGDGSQSPDSLAYSSKTQVAQASGVAQRRFFQNALDTEARCSTPPTRMRQLERSYNGTRWLGLSGSAMVALDVSAAGGLDSAFVVDEWPLDMGIGAQALELAKSLTFTPGFRGSAAVPARVLMPVTFPEVDADFLSWAKGEGQAGGVIDSLCAKLPKATVDMDPKALVKLMDFPRKAKRYVWEGEAVVQYQVDAEGKVSHGRVLQDSEPKYAFGDHALDIARKLKLALPAGLSTAPGDHLRVVQRFVFDRKRYDRARKEVERGFEFAPILLSVVETDSSRYHPGLEQLEWLLNDFSGKDSAMAWPELDLTVVLRQNGTPLSLAARPLGPETAPDPALLQSLALSFTWGHPAKADVDDLDTLAVLWKPRRFMADSSNCPPALMKLLHGVAY